jgi:hypothetical protein
MTEDEYVEQQANNHDLGPAERYSPERILELQRIFNARDQSALDRLYAQELATVKKLYPEEDIAAARASNDSDTEKSLLKIMEYYTLNVTKTKRWIGRGKETQHEDGNGFTYHYVVLSIPEIMAVINIRP